MKTDIYTIAVFAWNGKEFFQKIVHSKIVHEKSYGARLPRIRSGFDDFPVEKRTFLCYHKSWLQVLHSKTDARIRRVWRKHPCY